MTEVASSVGTARRPGPHHRAAIAIGAVFVVGVVAAFLLPQWGVLTPDTKPELYLNPSRMLGRELSAWRPVPHLGSPNYHPGIAPITAVVWGLQELGIAPWLTQRLLAITLTLVGAAGTAMLARHLTARSGLVPVVAGVAYAIHPYAIVAGATLPIRLPHAVLPWFVLAGVLALGRGGWRWPAVTALAYAAMGGINGGIVNLLLAMSLPVAAVFVARTEPVPGRVVWRRALAVAGWCVLVSLYWLVPTLLAAGSTATDVAATTEAPEAVATTSSPIESLRGLGMWTLYLVIGGRPEVPGHVAYLTHGGLAAATLGLPVLAAIGAAVDRSRARLLGAGLLVMALPIMVGLFPPERASPLGRLLSWSFTHVPGAIGFRTTNKIGSLLALGIAILVGSAVAGRWRGRSLAPVVVGVVAMAALPLWVGNAQPVTLDVPDYWEDASEALDTDEPGRLLFAPGAFLARYDWGYGGVDDLDTALFDQREVVWRPTVPAGSRPAHNLLTAFDVGMNTRSLGPEAAAAYLSLLGVSDVLVRADSANTVDGATTAASLLETYTAIQGAEVTNTWGPSVVQAPELVEPAPATAALTQVSLPGGHPWRVTALEDNLVLTGDAFAIGHLVDAGYAQVQDRSLGWLDQLTREELIHRLGVGGRVVMTDTNQRRRWDVRGLDRAHTTVMASDERVDPAETRARTTDASTQTTAVIDGGVNITSSDDDPSLLRIDATTPPSFAADGDPNTTWLTGAFNSEEESWIRLDYGDDLPLDTIRIATATTLDRAVSRLRITTEDEEFLVDVPRGGEVLVGRLSESSWLRVDVVKARGEGRGPVGITDISVAGRSIRTGMALPPALDHEDDDLSAAVAAAPVDVVLTRMQGDPATPLDDEERNLLREFTVPDDRSMALTATVRPNSPPEHLLDAAALRSFAGTITSDTATEAGALGRASQAFDADPDTAWRPLGPSGALTVTTPSPRRIDQVTVRRPAGAEPALLRLQAGAQDHEVRLTGARTRFRLPSAVRADEISLTIAAPGLEGQVAPILDIEMAGVETAPITADTRLVGCAGIGTMDGVPVWGEVDASLERLVSGQPMFVEGCDPVPVGAGRHRYDSGLGWAVDQLVLRSEAAEAPAPTEAPSAPREAGAVRLLAGDRTSHRVQVSVDERSVVSTGIAWDPRWRARIGDRSLGPPTQVGGYAVGWVVPAGDHELSVTYAPQEPVRAGMVASAVVVLVLVVVVVPLRRRRS